MELTTPRTRRTFLQAMGMAAALAETASNARAFVDPDVTLTDKSIFQMTIRGGYRYITCNDIPNHPVGKFPDRGCPNTIQPQNFHFRMPLSPRENHFLKPLVNRIIFGVGLDGVPFDPGTAAFWNNQRGSIWNYCLLTGHLRLGLDQSHAHVQGDGTYHYHGVPTDLIRQRRGWGKVCLIGFAADGFPMYGPWGYKNPHDSSSGIKLLKSSYQLKTGNRPNPPSGPGGKYDGTFEGDFNYVPGLGDLDQANGRYGITPEYPHGTFYYVVTYNFPQISRFFRGTPDHSFYKQPPRRLRRGRYQRGQGPRQFGPPGFGPPPGFGFGPPRNP